MKVLAVGSIPPPAGGHRDALLAEVLRRRSEGDAVQVLAVDPLAAAHRYLSAPGLAAVIEIALSARGVNAVVLQLEPGLPVRHGAGRLERTVALMGLAAALRGKQVTIRLDHRDDLPGGPGGRAANELWKIASAIEVGDETLRAELAPVLGSLADRLAVAPTSRVLTEAATAIDRGSPQDWGDGAEATASHVLEVVRRRAAAEREAIGRRGRLPIPGGGTGTRVAQWQWLPVPGAGVPDLGPIAVPASNSRIEARRSAPSLRRQARRLLAVAERHSATRPAAHLARMAWVELRGSVRGV
jgi:hypothetical protein